MICIVCNEKTDLWYDPQFNLDYHYCPACGFIAQDRQQLSSFQEERKEYDRHENSIENEGYVNFFRRFLDNALTPFASLGEGLDYGSGPEPVLSQVMARDYGVLPDIYDLHFQPDRIFEGKTYDFVVSTEVIEHVKDPMEVIGLFGRHLKSGGIAAVMTLFHQEDQETFLNWWYRRDITHISFFTPRTFAYMAEKNGLEVIYCDDSRYVTLRKV